MVKERIPHYLEQSISDTFEKTFSQTPEVLSCDSISKIEEECVISSIGFTGLLEGSCSMSFPESSACKLVGRMLGEETSEFTSEVMDGIGEILNMIIGGVKMRAREADCFFDIGCPTYFKGSRMVILTGVQKAHMVTRNFNLGDIVFAISLMFKEVKSQENKDKLKQDALALLKQLESQ